MNSSSNNMNFPRKSLALVLTLILSACGSADEINDEELQADCASDHIKVGNTGEFSTLFHDVSGTVRVIDDCTLEITNFNFDGGGLDIRITGSATGDFSNGVALTDNLLRSEAYENETLTLTLPVGVTLDDVSELSVWCVTVSENFGDASI